MKRRRVTTPAINGTFVKWALTVMGGLLVVGVGGSLAQYGEVKRIGATVESVEEEFKEFRREIREEIRRMREEKKD